MHQILTYFLFLLFPLLISATNWYQANSPTNQNLARLDIIDAHNGYAVSYDGLILKLQNKQWQIADSILNLYPTDFLQNDSLRSMGKNPGDVYTIRMVDGQNGWMAVNQSYRKVYSMFQMRNGKWRLWKNAIALKVRDFDFLSPAKGIAVGGNGCYLFSDNSWQFVHLPIDGDFRSVRYVDDDAIYIAGSRGIILERKNGLWQKVDTPVKFILRDMDFVSPNEGWFVGNNGTILHYKNSIVKKETSSTGENLWAIDMINNRLGYAVGKNGIILKYNGNKWTVVASSTRADLHDIEMINANEGWIVGAFGTILHFSPASPVEQKPREKFLFIDQVHIGSKYLMDRVNDIHGVTVADFNNDFMPDIYLTGYQSLNHLLINSNKGYFIDQVIKSGTGGNIETRLGKRKYEYGSLAADFDRDGDTDLFLGGQKNTLRIFANRGDLEFDDATEKSGFPTNINSITASIADFNADGFPDIVVADEKRGVRIFENTDFLTFKEQKLHITQDHPDKITALAVSDFNEDNTVDVLAFYNHSEPILLLNNGNTQWNQTTIEIENGKLSEMVNSVCLADFNCDARLDLFICSENGKDALLIKSGSQPKYIDFSDRWKVLKGGRSFNAVAEDFDEDGDTDIYVSRYGKDYFYENESSQRFTEKAGKIIYTKTGYINGINTGAAKLDIDDDNDVDLVVGNLGNWSALLENKSNDSSGIKIYVHGVADTKEALGAKVIARSGYRIVKYAELLPAGGYFSQNESFFYVGMKRESNVDIDVTFLNGVEVHARGVEDGATVHLYQAGEFERYLFALKRDVLLLLHGPFVKIELLKLVLLVALIIFSMRFIERKYKWQSSLAVSAVLGLLAVYGGLSWALLENGGLIFQILPFSMLVLAIAMMILINEQYYRSVQDEEKINKIIRQASRRMSEVQNIDRAVDIALTISLSILTEQKICAYIYYPFGNYLLLKDTKSQYKIDGFPAQFRIAWHKLADLTEINSPFGDDVCKKFNLPFSGNNTVFSLTNKDQFYGLIVIDAAPDSQAIKSNGARLNDLYQQLSTSIANICLLETMQDQQKLAAIGSFSSGLIHNLKNPIDGLRMIIEVMKNEIPADRPENEYVNALHEGIVKLKKDLLHSFDFIQIENAMYEPVDINALVSEVIGRFEKYNITNLKAAFSDRVETISGDKEQLSHALESLMKNALEASAGKGDVVVETKPSIDNSTIQISIRDSGKGLTTEEIGRLSRIFYSTRGDGRGLGLTITRNIIENHKGHIEIMSTENNGTEFSIILPKTEQQVTT